MKRLLLLTISMSLIIGCSKSSNTKYRKGQVLVKLKSSNISASSQVEKYGASIKESIGSSNTYIISVDEGAEQDVIDQMSEDALIEIAELDTIYELAELIPNDPKFSDQWFHPVIKTPQAWELGTGEGVVIGVLDTGINPNHTDLKGQILTGYNVISESSDANETKDVHGHGTYIAGIIAAITDNSVGVSGVAYNSKVVPIRISNDSNGSATLSSIIKGVKWAMDNDIDIISISYNISKSLTIQTIANDFKNNGGLVFVSSGNYGNDLNCEPSPATILVGATQKSNQITSFSSYGDCLDLVAPGASIRTTNKGGGYSSVSGTSFSAPMAAAVAGLVKGYNPTLSPDEIEKIMKDSADKSQSGDFNPKYGYGIVDAYSALLMTAGSDIPEPDLQAPTLSIISPASNSVVMNTITIKADASDNKNINNVKFYLNNTLIGTDKSSPYSFTLDTTKYPNGEYSIRVIATDSSSNSTTKTINIQVDNIVEDTPKEPIDPVVPEPETPLDLKINSVKLYDSTGKEIGELTDGSSFALAGQKIGVMSTAGKDTSKVNFILKGAMTHTQREGVKPYSLFGDNRINPNTRSFIAGNYTLTVQALRTAEETGPIQTINFTIVKPEQSNPEPEEPAPEDPFDDKINVISLKLYDYDAKEFVGNLSTGTSFDLAGRRLGVLAVMEDNTKSVKFELAGTKEHIQKENVYPFTLYGDNGLVPNGRAMPAGNYNLSVQGFSASRFGGLPGQIKSVNFTLTQKDNSSGGTPLPEAPMPEEPNPEDPKEDFAINSVMLYDTKSGEIITELKDGAQIAAAGKSIGVIASTGSLAKRVVFKLSGDYSHNQTELKLPYSLFGDNGQIPNGRVLNQGSYKLEIQTRSSSGENGELLIINFVLD